MTFLRRLSIANAMILITAFGLITICLFASFGITTEYRKVQTATRDLTYVEVVGAISGMIHELQKERGASAGFLASKGANFAEALPRQRLLSDGVIAAFRDSLAIVPTSQLTPSLSEAIDVVETQISALTALRARVDALDIPLLDAVGQITRLNRSAIKLAPEFGNLISHGDAARAVQRHSILMTGKGVIGLERATGAAGLARAHAAGTAFPQAVLDRFKLLVVERETLFDLYQNLASPALATMLIDAQSTAEAKTVTQIRSAIQSGDKDQVLAYTSEEWFEKITKLLSLFKAMEDAGVGEFRDHLHTAVENERALLRAEIILFIAAFMLLSVVSGGFVRFSRRALNRVSTRVDKLAEGDILSEIVQESQPDLGKITAALAQFQTAEQADLQVELEKRSAKGIERIVEHVQQGVFDQRLRLRDLEGPSWILGTGINEIMTVAEGVVTDQREKDQKALEEQKRATAAQEQTVKSVNEVVAAFSVGDFQRRVDVNDKTGVWAEICTGINQIATTCEGALGDVENLLTGMAQGNISQRMTGDYEGTFADIRTSANQSFDQLQNTFSQIAASVTSIEGTATEVSKATADLTTRSEGQARAVDTSLIATNGLGESLSVNAKQLTECRKLIDRLDNKTSEGKEVTEKAVETISKMESASEEMSKIVATIEDIAFQTNLLALNASVEAARAGSAGKGFAVVASEVRSLSSRCADASRQIGELISESVSQIKSGAGNVRQTGDAMSEVRDTMGDVLTMIDNITTAGESQANGLRELGTAMTELDASAKSNLALATTNSGLTDDLLKLKTQLSNAVSVFQVENATARIAAE